MTAVQLDLLDALEQEQDDDDEQAARHAGDFTWTATTRGEASCIHCHQPTVWYQAAACTIPGRGMCMGQYLAGNHMRYAARQVRDHDSPSARQQLRELIDLARARQVDVDTILAETREAAA